MSARAWSTFMSTAVFKTKFKDMKKFLLSEKMSPTDGYCFSWEN